MTRYRDLALIVLAGVVACTAMVCVTILAARGRVESAAAIGVLSGAGGTLAGVAIGRLTGAPAAIEGQG